MAALTASGIPVFGTTVFLTAHGLPVFRNGSTTEGLTVFGEPVFGLPSAGGQLLRPDSDIAADGWLPSTGTDLFAMLDEVVPDDADYIYSPDNPTTQQAEIKFSPGTGTHSTCTSRVRLQAVGLDIVFGLELLQGAFVLDSWTESVSVAEGAVTREHVSSGISITDAADLRVRIGAGEVAGVVRRLATDCTLPGFTPSEAQPFDLDLCTINDGDDITELLTDIRDEWPAGFYVRAPSRDISVICDSIVWPEATKEYMFFEDESSSNTMLIQHAASPADFYRLWKFENFDTVKIGGPNLTLTFKGNHPGLANCDVQEPILLALGVDAGQAAQGDANRGLIDFLIDDGSLATLADVRANIKFSQHYSIYTSGSTVEGGTTDKIAQLNVSGLHYATSGVFFHSGVKNAWSDPDNFVVSDPYVRGIGWTGVAPGQTQGGLLMGCHDQDKDQNRFNSFAGYYVDSLTGGVTIEYGACNWIQRFSGHIGNSAADPYVVRIKDWYVSGPGTAYAAGVRVKKTVETIFFKGDPHDTYGGSGPVRFVKFVKLADDYGSGPGSDNLAGCSPSCAYNDGPDNFLRLENSVTGRINRGWHIILDGDWDTNFVRGDLFLFAFDSERSCESTLEAASGTTITDLITMHDTNTVTGDGTFTNLQISDHSANTPGRDNTIIDTNIAGVVTIDASTGTTTIDGVTFTGAARAIITVGAGSTADVSGITAPSGSTITGAGTLIYNGSGASMPYAI